MVLVWLAPMEWTKEDDRHAVLLCYRGSRVRIELDPVPARVTARHSCVTLGYIWIFYQSDLVTMSASFSFVQRGTRSSASVLGQC